MQSKSNHLVKSNWVQATTGINELSIDNIISVYPNPANDHITIENNSFIKGQTISVYDIQGELLLQQPMLQAKTSVNISAFSRLVFH